MEKFLKPCGMGYLDKSFIQSHINGGVLIALQESHLKDLGCDLVGHRLMLMDYIQVSISVCVCVCVRLHAWFVSVDCECGMSFIKQFQCVEI